MKDWDGERIMLILPLQMDAKSKLHYQDVYVLNRRSQWSSNSASTGQRMKLSKVNFGYDLINHS